MAVPSIRTERLVLRPWAEDDVDALYQLWIDPDVRRYLWDDVVIGRDVVTDAVRAHFETVEAHGIGWWAIHNADEEPLIGFCGFRSLDDMQEIEIVYGLAPAYWGRGLVTEAARAALDYLWAIGHTHVYAQTDPPNLKSIAVLRRLGFRQVSSPNSLLTFLLERPADWKRA